MVLSDTFHVQACNRKEMEWQTIVPCNGSQPHTHPTVKLSPHLIKIVTIFGILKIIWHTRMKNIEHEHICENPPESDDPSESPSQTDREVPPRSTIARHTPRLR